MKTILKSLLSQFGYEIHRVQEPLLALRHYGIRTVLDVGANIGQFAQRTRKILPTAQIHCFEPVPDVYEELVGRHRRLGIEAHCLALTDHGGQAEIYRSNFSPCSSMLPMTPLHIQAFPHTGDVKTVAIECETLDSWIHSRNLRPPILLKIDVQGGETRVLNGGSATLPQIAMIIIEVSFAELYRGQSMFADTDAMLRAAGFDLHAMFDLSYHPQDMRMLQADAIYVRASGGGLRSDAAGQIRFVAPSGHLPAPTNSWAIPPAVEPKRTTR